MIVNVQFFFSDIFFYIKFLFQEPWAVPLPADLQNAIEPRLAGLAAADGDDINGSVPDDEDGVGFPTAFIPGVGAVINGQGIMQSSVVRELRRRHPGRNSQGFTVFCTGLSGSGKSSFLTTLILSAAMMLEWLGARDNSLTDFAHAILDNL